MAKLKTVATLTGQELKEGAQPSFVGFEMRRQLEKELPAFSCTMTADPP
jgi:hypothetical protein